MRRFILVFLVAAPLVAILLWPHSPLGAVGLVALSHAFVLYPTLRPNVQWLGPVLTRFATEGKEVWLTIDDGPAEDTMPLLQALEARDVRATFFVKGRLAAARPDLIREILARGHTVGNHSHNHPSATFWCLFPGQVQREIDECNRVLRELTGNVARLFRAPVGMKNPAVHPALERRGMLLVGWSARAFDTTTDDPDRVWRRLMPRMESGAIIVLHQGRPSSILIVDRVVGELQKRGYEFIVPDAGRLKTNR